MSATTVAFYPHSLCEYDSNLHAFPGLSSTKAINVSTIKYVIVEGKKYKVYKYIWASSIVENRYIGGFLPYFKSKQQHKPGIIIYNEENEPISCITNFINNLYVISGIGYETFDIDVSESIEIKHHILKDGNSIYGSIQNKYPIIKPIAQEKSKLKSGPIVKYNIWVGKDITQITAVDNQDKEVMRTRIKHGGYIIE
ncbi:Partial schlafen-like protein [Eptesipox virus]|uniref:Partial schlafen-like protein n=1 Tax=Eptesipox virus TaxID=1329402 RepID=A0A220T6L4_9POXV|nr:Partial schlafen-like protein [Eptesipox virus]ASK51361.1 Partial schlafen-like protein [Eptesipox virus]WAH71119.1 schlafen-like protein [Eptesipox virus]